ncbi:MAG TPA: hypothetical protein DDZ51_22795 [Planctomycetaceae bacterium]|nr:hypothetical protein [Planctomycetaceae bacterium]
MSARETKLFLKWYAQQDLNALTAREVTQPLIHSVGLTTAIVIVLLTLALALPMLQKSRLAVSPLAQSLWIGQPEIESQEITLDRIDRLHKELAKPLPGIDRYQIRRFHLLTLRFASANSVDYPLMRGGTIGVNDPLARRMLPALAWNPADHGVVATKSLLRALGYSEDDNGPDSLLVRVSSNEPVMELPIVAIVDINLPDSMLFLVTETEYERIYAEGHEKASAKARTGMIGHDWPTQRELMLDADFIAKFQNQRGLTTVRRQLIPDRFVHVWELESNVSLRRSEWIETVKMLRDWLIEKDESYQAVDEFVLDTTLIDPESRSIDLSTQPYRLGEIWVADLDDLKDASVACRKAGYAANESAVQQVEDIQKSSKIFGIGGLVIGLSLLMNASWGIKLIQELRCKQKLAEIGMLKAIGMNKGELASVFAHQATFIWRSGSKLGLLGSTIGLAICCLLLTQSWAEVRILITCGLVIAALTLVGSRWVIKFSIMKGTENARNVAPMDTMRTS